MFFIFFPPASPHLKILYIRKKDPIKLLLKPNV